MYRPETDVFRETRKKPRRVLWWLMGALSLLVVLVAGTSYAVLYSGLLGVKEVEVRGGDALPHEQLLAALSAKLTDSTLRGLVGPDNILFWMFRGSEPKRLYTLPLAAEVTLIPHPWERKVEVVVEKRELFGVWCVPEGSCFGFDQEGTLLGEAPEVEGALMVRVRDENARPLVLGQRVLPNLRWVRNFFDTIAALKEQNLPVVEFIVKPLVLHEWWVRLESGTLIYMSFDFVPENLSAILENFRTKPDFVKLTYLDLRVPNRMYYR